MKRVLAVGAMAVGLGCSSGPANVCCIDYNGAKSNWQCPTSAAESACCTPDSDSGIPGCIDSPMNPASSSCTDNASPSDCP